MDPRKLDRARLVEFTANAATGVANGKVTGFLAAQNTAISDALIAANAELAAADTNQVQTRTLSIEGTKLAVEKQTAVLDILSGLKFAMKGVKAPSSNYDVLGFDAPAETRLK